MRAKITITIDGKLEYVQEKASVYLKKLVWVTDAKGEIERMMYGEKFHEPNTNDTNHIIIKYEEEF